MTFELSVFVAIIGCFIGLAGWLAGRDKKISNDAEWKGTVNAKLDAIRSDVGEVGTDVKCLQSTLTEHGERLTAVESSAKQAHHRIDGIEAKIK